jgi:protein phosphatase PTC2/3
LTNNQPTQGIWDCLSSQQVVDFVRLHVAQGKELAEIAEIMCDHCLAPDTSSGAGIGCDNMTVLIVAILHGRTKEEWYSWVTDRVQRGYGYETPSAPPQLYAQSRLLSFRARREAQLARERARQDQDDTGSGSGTGIGGYHGEASKPSSSTVFARVLGSTGGISFHPGSPIMSDSGTLMFTNTEHDDSDDSSETEDPTEEPRPSFIWEHLELSGRLPALDDDAERDESGTASEDDHGQSGDGGAELDSGEHKNLTMSLLDYELELRRWRTLQNRTAADDDGGDADGPANGVEGADTVVEPPKSLPNGDVKMEVDQLKSQLGKDEPSPAVKAEGLLDSSENPVKV